MLLLINRNNEGPAVLRELHRHSKCNIADPSNKDGGKKPWKDLADHRHLSR